MKIFENGYLKSEFINPNYRGLVGWSWDDGVILSIDKNNVMFRDKLYNDSRVYFRPLDIVKIPQFTPKDIPVGELCWVGMHYTGEQTYWYLRPFCEYWSMQGSSFVDSDRNQWDLCVPYLIAETEEDAERLKEWNI